MIVPEDFSGLTDPVVREVIWNTLQEERKEDDVIERLFKRETTKRATDRFQGEGGLADIPEFTGTLSEDNPTEQYTLTVTYPEYAGKIVIRKKLLEDDLYDEVKKYPRMQGVALHRTQQKLAIGIFNNAFNSGAAYLGGDGVSLCSSAHPSKSSSDTQDNSGTTALSHAALLSTLRLMRKYRDDRGELISCRGTMLIVPLALIHTAQEITQSELKPYTTDNTVNVARRGLDGQLLKVFVSDRLDSDTNWFVVDDRMMKGEYLKWITKTKEEITTSMDFDRRASQHAIYWRGKPVFTDWRWIYGHQV